VETGKKVCIVLERVQKVGLQGRGPSPDVDGGEPDESGKKYPVRGPFIVKVRKEPRGRKQERRSFVHGHEKGNGFEGGGRPIDVPGGLFHDRRQAGFPGENGKNKGWRETWVQKGYGRKPVRAEKKKRTNLTLNYTPGQGSKKGPNLGGEREGGTGGWGYLQPQPVVCGDWGTAQKKTTPNGGRGGKRGKKREGSNCHKKRTRGGGYQKNTEKDWALGKDDTLANGYRMELHKEVLQQAWGGRTKRTKGEKQTRTQGKSDKHQVPDVGMGQEKRWLPI